MSEKMSDIREREREEKERAGIGFVFNFLLCFLFAVHFMFENYTHVNSMGHQLLFAARWVSLKD